MSYEIKIVIFSLVVVLPLAAITAILFIGVFGSMF